MSKIAIPTITESIVWMNGVHAIMVQSIHKKAEILWICYQSILHMNIKQYRIQKVVYNIQVF